MTTKKKTNTEKNLLVTQIKSPIGREESHRKTLIGLGLNKIGRSRQLSADSSVLGMIDKVKYLLKVEHI